MRAGSLPDIAKAEDAGNLGQSEAGSLGGSNELQPTDHNAVVPSVSVRFALRGR
ncbi:hypothetical protein GCM10008097_25420 [Mycetocola manganoxydans]|nr:hypothetical protein GCM10008097_25420 [Mycetocola manganoxydans]